MWVRCISLGLLVVKFVTTKDCFSGIMYDILYHNIKTELLDFDIELLSGGGTRKYIFCHLQNHDDLFSRINYLWYLASPE